MSADPNETRFTPTYEDTRNALRVSSWRPGAVAMGGAFIAIVIAGPIPKEQWELRLAAAVYALICTILLLIAAWLILLPRRARRYYNQQASLRDEYTVSWSDAGLLTTTPRLMMRLPWSDYHRVRETKSVILLYTSDAMFQFLPTRALTEAQRASLRPYLDAIMRRAPRRSETPHSPPAP